MVSLGSMTLDDPAVARGSGQAASSGCMIHRFLLLSAFLFVAILSPILAQQPPQEAGKSASIEISYPSPISDPIEPVNRSLGFLNHGIMIGLIHPTAYVYRLIIPRPVRKCVNNAGENLAYPVRLVNNLLQAEWAGAWNETQRFGINTTVGILGLFDPATHWDIPPSREDTGLTFGKWGWSNHMYLMLPLFGPSSERDLFGKIGDTLLNPATYLFPAGPIFTYNRLSDEVIRYRQFTTSEYDPYALSRDMYAVDRREATVIPTSASEDESAIETLQAVRFQPEEPGFFLKRKNRKVFFAPTGEKIPYSLWLQKEPATFVYILPGMGGHRDSTSTLALAELLFDAGYSVVSLSSSMNWEFIQRISSVPVPGYGPIDGRDIAMALETIHRDLQARYPERIQGRVLMGMSLGAYHTLLIAAGETQGKLKGIQFDRYVAINPPLDLFYGMTQLDAFYNAPVTWPASERETRMQAAIDKASKLLKPPDKFTEPPVFTPVEAQFLIGLLYRISLRDTIHASQRITNIGRLTSEPGLMNREDEYEEILLYSYKDYYQFFVLPTLRTEKGRISAEYLQYACDLKSHQHNLLENRKAFVFTNMNDFLLSDGDVRWLKETFPDERLVLSPDGGHLGNLAEPETQSTVLSLLQGAARP